MKDMRCKHIQRVTYSRTHFLTFADEAKGVETMLSFLRHLPQAHVAPNTSEAVNAAASHSEFGGSLSAPFQKLSSSEPRLPRCFNGQRAGSMMLFLGPGVTSEILSCNPCFTAAARTRWTSISFSTCFIWPSGPTPVSTVARDHQQNLQRSDVGGWAQRMRTLPSPLLSERIEPFSTNKLRDRRIWQGTGCHRKVHAVQVPL